MAGIQGHATAGTTNTTLETVHNDLTETNTELEAVNTKLDAANTKLQAIADNTDTLEVQVASVNVNTDTLETLIASTNTKTDTGNASLSSVDGKLTTGNTSLSSIDSKLDLRATSAKQDTQTTALNLLHTDNGNEGSVPPTLNGVGAAGILGYLRNLLDKLITISSQQTSGSQLTKITNGTQSADTLAGDSGQNALIATRPQKTVTWSVSATGAVANTSLDVGAYNTAVVTLSGMGAGDTIKFEGSNDNFVSDTFNLPYQSNFSAHSNASITGAQTNPFIVALPCKYFRINVTAITGTAGGVVEFKSDPQIPAYPVTVVPLSATLPVAVSGTVATSQGSGNAWVTGGALSSISNNASTAAATGSTTTYTASFSWWGLQVIVAGTGSLSALNLVLEGSADGGTNWKTITTFTGTATDYVVNTTPMPFQTIRTRIVTLTPASLVPTVTTRIVGCQ